MFNLTIEVNVGIFKYKPSDFAKIFSSDLFLFPLSRISLSFLNPALRSIFYIISFSWLSKNSEAFSVGVPKLDKTGLTGIIQSFIDIKKKIHFPQTASFLC